MTAPTSMLVCELGDVLGVFSSRENSAGSLARSGEAWESLGNREMRFAFSADLDHAKVIYDRLVVGDGADNDLKYATMR